MKAQILQFSGVLSHYLPKVGKRFIPEMIYGIQARQSVRISQIARALNENIALKKTEERLCRQLDRPGLMRQLRHQLLWLARSRINDDPLLILDTSDISKKYAQKMQYMAGVHDGSHDTKGYGYWLLNIIAANVGKQNITPLYMHLYSQNAPEFKSENRHIIDAIDTVIPYAGNQSTWVIDRGGDRSRIFQALMEKNQKFIIRLQGKRHLGLNGVALPATTLAQHCKLKYHEKIIKEDGHREKALYIAYGYKQVTLPGHKNKLFLVVIHGFGEKPMMLLTNRKITPEKESVRYILSAYIKRWKIEDTFRLMKQSYNLEDIRILTYRRLQNMALIVLAALFFACVWLGNAIKMRILTHHALKAAKRFFGIPDFRYYAITDGIKEIMAGIKETFTNQARLKTPQTQLRLFET